MSQLQAIFQRVPTSSLPGAVLRALGIGSVVGAVILGEAVFQGERASTAMTSVILIVGIYTLTFTRNFREAATRRLRGDVIINAR